MMFVITQLIFTFLVILLISQGLETGMAAFLTAVGIGGLVLAGNAAFWLF